MSQSALPPKMRIDLNLLHSKENTSKLPEKFLKWLITYGRFIVIFVEVIVVTAFLARFKFDADLDDLKRKINLDLPYVEGLSTDEALIKQTQNKIALIDKNYLDADKWQETIVNISAQTPASIEFQGLSLEEDAQSVNFQISASTTSNSDLGIFLNNLRSQKDLRKVDLASISFDHDQIIFTITGSKAKQ